MARSNPMTLFSILLFIFFTTTFALTLQGRAPRCDLTSCENCCGNFCCAPLDDCVSNRCKAPPPPPPAPVTEIGLQMQYQQSVQWCWIAVAVSINAYYHPTSGWEQCSVMTDVGHRLNGFDKTTSVCPTAATIAANPPLFNALASVFSPISLYILDTWTTGTNTQYLKSGYVKDPLETTRNFASVQPASLSKGAIAAEVSARRPVAVNIMWKDGNQHVVAIAGVASDWGKILILDPVSGRTIMKWNDFPSKYGGGATILSYVFTKP